MVSDLGDQVRQRLVARLGHMDLIPHPMRLALAGRARLLLVGRVNPFCRCRERFWVAESQLIAVANVLLGPDLTQDRDLWKAANLLGSLALLHCREELLAIDRKSVV